MNHIMETKENSVLVYLIENKKLFLEMILELKRQIEEKDEGLFSLFQDNKELKIHKEILLITDIFDLNFKNKKIITALYKKLKEYIFEEDLYKERIETEGCLKKLLTDIIDFSDYSLTMGDDIDYEGLFKMFHISFEEQYTNYLEKIIDYISICHKLKMMNHVVFVNLKTILSEEECKKLYQQCFYKKISIILLENQEKEGIIKEEHKIIIDNDLCEIY